MLINQSLHYVTTVAVSQTTSQTISYGASNVSGNSIFSVSSGDESLPRNQILHPSNCRIFSFAELKLATKNFRADTVLGEGGFGKVFKGWIDNKTPGKTGSGTVVAVKKLNAESLQGLEEWQVILLSLVLNPECLRYENIVLRLICMLMSLPSVCSLRFTS